jgi:Tfp pilus assembly protein PilO
MDKGSVFALMAVVAGAVIILFPFMRALAERIRPRALDSTVRDELQALREDLLAELQQTRHEISELSERVDFTERLLAKKSPT